MAGSPSHDAAPQIFRRPIYAQVLIAVAIGILVGHFFPGTGKSLQPLGDGFIRLIKMLIGPIIFCTLVHGIASMSDMKKLGRVGLKALIYFEVVSTFALIIGLIVVNVLKPGAGFNISATALDPNASALYSEKAHALSAVQFLLKIIPSTLFDAFASGDLLQILLVSVLTGFAISFMGEKSAPVLRAVDLAGQVFFGIMRIVIKAAPIGAFGAMAYTVGSYGIGSLNRLVLLMAGFI